MSLKQLEIQTLGELGAGAEKPRSGWHILGDYILSHLGVYGTAVLSIAGSSVLAAIIPQIIGRFADVYAKGALTFDRAEYFAIWVLIAGLCRVILGWLGRVLIAQHGRIITFHIREALFKKWETLTPAYYHGHSTGELLSHALSDVDVIRQVAAMGITTAISGVFMLSASVYFMVTRMHWQLALAGLLPLLAIPGLIHYFGPKIKAQSGIFQASLGGMAQTVEEIVGGIRTVKAFGNEAIALERFQAKVGDLVRQKMKFVRLATVFGALIPLVSAFGFIVVIWYGSYLTINKTITLGSLVAFLLYLTLLRQPLEQLGNMLNTVQRASASLARLAALLDVRPDTVAPSTTVSANPIKKGEIDVRNLSFRYPGANFETLQDLSFTIRAGKTLGIVGAIGSGKTTLAHLLLRLYEPPAGTVFIDGVDIRDYSLQQLRSAIAYVPQNSFLFSTSISANIAFSEPNTPDQLKVEAASKMAAIDADIQKFPDVYATEIGERGIRLSGGQKQRVAIARMIYKRAPIRILDDSLSAVDTKTERRILNHLAQSRAKAGADNGASIVISHRLSAVMNADEIIVLDGGRIAERGNHEALLRLNRLYAQLWNLQLGEIGKSDTEGAEQGAEAEILEIFRVEDEQALKGESEEEPRS